jgi:hypothetical protein
MKTYRFYFMSPDNVMTGEQSHDCSDEMSARTQARELCSSGHVEIWDGANRIAVVMHSSPLDDNGRTRRYQD